MPADTTVDLNHLGAMIEAAAADRQAVLDEYAEALRRAEAAFSVKHYGEAGGICADLLAAEADQAPVLALLGTLQAAQGHLAEGIASLERALAIQGDVAAWWATLCRLHLDAGREDDAIFAGGMALALDPRNADVMVTIAIAHARVDPDWMRGKRVQQYLYRALAVDQEHARAHMALGEYLLSEGDMDAGWREYAWHKKAWKDSDFPVANSAPWSGQTIPGGRILVICDGGYGDTMQFCRYVPLIAQFCDEVLLACPPQLAPLIVASHLKATVITNTHDIPPHAAHVRVMDLPGLFFATVNGSTGVKDGIPRLGKYLLADDCRVAEARRQRSLTGNPEPALHVGLCWRGRSTHKNDHRRSMSVATMLPLLHVGGCGFHCLQNDVTSAELATIAKADIPSPYGFHLYPTFKDWGETAAIIATLDLVISVDTAVAHLAAAMGKRTWILLSQPAEWRWQLERDDSPWYPTARLWRQGPDGWDGLIDLTRLVLASGHLGPPPAHDGAIS